MKPDPIHLDLEIPEKLAAYRLDQALAELLPQYSRTRLKEWIELDQVTVNGKSARPKDKVFGGEKIIIDAVLEAVIQLTAEAIALSIVYEDDDILIIDKPAGLIVHPGAGHPSGTLVNALLNHYPPLEQLPRAGLIHRIDKDTSGLLAVAKTLTAQTALTRALQKRQFKREYFALVMGDMTGGGTINQPIARHPTQRTKMAIRSDGRAAVTHYRVLEHFNGFCAIKAMLETGRTHQIRVHLASIQHPLLGDPVYSGRARIPAGATPELMKALREFPRQALHAMTLGFIHPTTHEECEWQSPLPDDLATLLELLRSTRACH